MDTIIRVLILWLSNMSNKVFQVIIKVISDVDFWKIFIPAISAIIAWRLNEKSKRLHEEFIRKETRYRNLLDAIEGFGSKSENKQELRKKFLQELKLAWLYCPDEIINSIHRFLGLKKDKPTANDSSSAVKDIIFSMRKDLLSRKIVKKTRLKAKDYQLIDFKEE